MEISDPETGIDALLRKTASRYRVINTATSVAEVKNLFLEGAQAVVVTEGRLLCGLLTRRDIRFEAEDDAQVFQIMTPRNSLLTLRYPSDSLFENARHMMIKHRVKRVLLVDDDFNFLGMIDETSIQKNEDFNIEIEDEEFALNASTPLTLLLGNVDHEGILSSLTASNRQYKKKVLESSPENWESIVKYFDNYVISSVLVKLTPRTFHLLALDDYKSVRDKLFSCIANVPNIIFVFEDLLIGKQQDEWREEYRPYPPSDILAEVLNWLESFAVELIPYRKNSEVTVLAESFLEDTEKNLILRLYVPSGRIGANEVDRFFQLFRDYLGRVERLNVRLDQRRTDQGIIYEFHGDTNKSQGELGSEFDEFLKLMEFCASNTDAAEALLTTRSLSSREAGDIVSRYSKEAKRLQVDLRQECERKVLAIRHRLESELGDLNPTAADWARIAVIVDAAIPSLAEISSGLSLRSTGLPQERHGGGVTINVRPQIIQSTSAIVAQEIYGNQYITSEDRQLLQLIGAHGGTKAKELESSVYELADKSVPHAERLGAKQKLKKFLIEAGKRSTDVAFGVLQTYIEKQLGL